MTVMAMARFLIQKCLERTTSKKHILRDTVSGLFFTTNGNQICVEGLDKYFAHEPNPLLPFQPSRNDWKSVGIMLNNGPCIGL